MDFKVAALNYDNELILKKYRPLRKIESKLHFDKTHYPYWIINIVGEVSGKLINRSIIREYRVVDGTTAKVSRLASAPDFDNNCAITDYEYLDKTINKEQAKNLAEENILKYWNKKYNHPFRPKVHMEIKELKVELVYKPYWVISNGKDYEIEKLMVVDGTTGLTGMPECSYVKKAWINLPHENVV